MSEIDELRQRIDALDERIYTALRERLEVAERIGELKKEAGIDTIDREREGQVIARAAELCGKEYAAPAERVCAAILRESCAVQQPGVSRVMDISRELLSAPVYPDDPGPRAVRIRSMEEGECYNLSEIHMGAHNGTHTDAPLHFIADGADIAATDPAVFCGRCTVKVFGERITAEDIDSLPEGCERLLIKGGGCITPESARRMVERGIRCVGVEGMTVGPMDDPREVHRILLGAGVGIIEALELSGVPEGSCFLSAAPLKIAGCEGAPCRALLFF